ncbi:hypothetical protein GGR92_000367 [Spirosoma lacussanchae]|uniref:hypothetical protein n=1 Tax=Spirosoma lacussanchae TaxID=1884249 RepID=UPI001109A3D2|nr:hypothetical protein [Spirosoma lacussanchae]
MKLLHIALVGVALLATAVQSSAQDDRKLRKDPTYSTGNYKHANKAATARSWEKNTGVAVEQPAPTDANLANYKRQVPAQQPVGGVTVEHTPSTDVADRNYKMQRPSTVTNSSGTGIARKSRKNADTTSASGTGN